MRALRSCARAAWRAGLCGWASLAAPAVLGADSPPAAPATFPLWAYLWSPEFPAAEADEGLHRLPGSTAAYSGTQARNPYSTPDWHPDEHPAMPEIVAVGRKPDVQACGFCHRAEGTGGPQSASLAGLPAIYFVRQMADFKSGARSGGGPARSTVPSMTGVARALSAPDVQAAAAYFAALKPRRIIDVVETETVPKTYVAGLYFAKMPAGGTEPLGHRIVEVPDDIEQFELRDGHALFTAYVPADSVAAGEALAKAASPGTPTVACSDCHGAELRGAGPIPPLAGRSPTYIVRQLHDFQHGARAGAFAAAMTPTVAALTEDDMIALAAYVASLPP